MRCGQPPPPCSLTVAPLRSLYKCPGNVDKAVRLCALLPAVAHTLKLLRYAWLHLELDADWLA